MSGYADNELKTSIVVNKKHDIGLAFNAVSHLVAGLVDLAGAAAYAFLDYPFAGGDAGSRLSTYPMIVLSAPNSSQVLRTWAAAREAGLACNLFTTAMIGSSAADQQSAAAATPVDEQDAVAVAIFGRAEEVNPLTRKFSVLR